MFKYDVRCVYSFLYFTNSLIEHKHSVPICIKWKERERQRESYKETKKETDRDREKEIV